MKTRQWLTLMAYVGIFALASGAAWAEQPEPVVPAPPAPSPEAAPAAVGPKASNTIEVPAPKGEVVRRQFGTGTGVGISVNGSGNGVHINSDGSMADAVIESAGPGNEIDIRTNGVPQIYIKDGIRIVPSTGAGAVVPGGPINRLEVDLKTSDLLGAGTITLQNVKFQAAWPWASKEKKALNLELFEILQSDGKGTGALGARVGYAKGDKKIGESEGGFSRAYQEDVFVTYKTEFPGGQTAYSTSSDEYRPSPLSPRLQIVMQGTKIKSLVLSTPVTRRYWQNAYNYVGIDGFLHTAQAGYVERAALEGYVLISADPQVILSK